MSGPAVITMAHGAGGAASRRLVAEHVVPRLGPSLAGPLLDAAPFEVQGTHLATTTDAHVVRPLRFPGGSIGALAVYGTVNDLAVGGARPRVLTAAFVLEEGLELATFDAELDAMADAARRAGVEVVAGDTKVVERGRADGMYIVTSGVGEVVTGHALSPTRMEVGDRVLLSGPVADHGTAVLLAREALGIYAEVRSDSTSVWPMASALVDAAGPALRVMRDPTRGGLATALNELADDAGLAIELDEAAVPMRSATRGACELLGLDPWHVANEGLLVAVVAEAAAPAALAAIRGAETGILAADVGAVTDGPGGRVVAHTTFGGRRVVDMLTGDPLPRIC